MCCAGARRHGSRPPTPDETRVSVRPDADLFVTQPLAAVTSGGLSDGSDVRQRYDGPAMECGLLAGGCEDAVMADDKGSNDNGPAESGGSTATPTRSRPATSMG